MKKNITAIFLALCMMISLLPSAFAADAVTAKFVVDKDTVEQGQEITVTATIDGAKNVNAVYSMLKYNKDVLEYVSSAKGSLMKNSYATLPSVTHSEKNAHILAYTAFTSPKDITKDVLFTATFKVKADADTKGYTGAEKLFSFDEDECMVSDSTGAEVKYTPEVPDTITVKEATTEPVTLTVTADKAEAAIGDVVTYTISSDNAIALRGYEFDLTYDTNKFEYTEGTVTSKADSDIAAITPKGDGAVKILWASQSGAADFTGALATVSFKIKAVGNLTLTGFTGVGQTGDGATASFSAELPAVKVIGDTIIDFVCDKTTLTMTDTMHVVVKASACTDIRGLEFNVLYDRAKFNIANPNEITVTEGANARLTEEGNIKYLFFAADDASVLNGDVELLSFDLIPKAEGTTDLSISEFVASPDVVTYNNIDGIVIRSAADTEKVKAVQDLINAVEDVTKDNYKTVATNVEAARSAYNALDEELKAMVSTDKLAAAEEALAAIAAEVKAVVDAIDALPEVTESNYKEAAEAVNAAKAAYDALSETEKADVTNADKLTAALAKIDECTNAVKAVVDAIDAIGEVTADNYQEKKAAIDAARAAYDALNSTLVADVTNADKLKAAEDAYENFYYEQQLKDIKVNVSALANGYIVTAVKQKPVANDQTVIIAVYDKTSGAVQSVSTFDTSKTDPYMVIADTANTTCKVFVWDSLQGMKPYESVEIVY